MDSLYHDFLLLDSVKDNGKFKSIKLDSFNSQFISKTESGSPIFLIKQQDQPLFHPDISFRYFNVMFNVRCIVYINKSEELEDVFCIIKFDSANAELFEVFVRCVSAGLSQFKGAMLVTDINHLINSLIKLFRSNSKPSENQLIGLWGELFTIRNSKNIPVAVSSWHSDNKYIYDFELMSIKYEVKATIGERRIHNFSLRQVSSTDEQNVFVVSYLLQKMTNGTTILDLAIKIDSLLPDSQTKEKLWTNIFDVMGSDISLSTSLAFDETYARRNVLYFNSKNIPKPIVECKAISSVRYQCDLSEIEYITDDSCIF